MATAASSSTILRLTTWNLSGCQRAAVAPSTWSKDNQMEAVVLELSQTKPHILCLQECPSPEWAAQHFPDYLLIGSTTAHAGYVSLLVDPTMIQKPSRLDTERLPAVAASIRIGGQEMAVASVHLTPFGGGAQKRYQQVQELQQLVDLPLIVAGDFNMRQAEDRNIERLLLHDAWKETGSDRLTKFTWNTIDNRARGGTFNEYYGSDTNQYTARYDRVYFTFPNVHNLNFQLMGNRPMPPSNNHFLSDHFGIAVEFEIGQEDE